MTTLQIKHSLTAGNTPSSLADGELAINEADELMFYKNATGVIRPMAMPFSSMDAMASNGLEINGGMELDQEHQGAAVAIANGSVPYVVDQWTFGFNHTANTAVFSANQSVLNAAATLGNNLGFGLRAISSTALVSPNIGDFAFFQQPIEGYRWERINYGLSIAHSVTIGFWVYATATGTGSVFIRNSTATHPTRSYVTNFTVAASNTLQWFTVTIPGDQAGAWLNGSSIGAYVGFCVASGSTYQTAANAWVTGNYIATPQNTNFYATNGNQVIITGVKILPGPSMPPVARYGLLLRPSSEEIRLCQRYLWTSVGTPYTCACISNAFTATGYLGGSFLFPVQMRATPTVILVGAGSWPVVNCTEPVVWLTSPNGFSLYATATAASNCYYYPGSGQGVKADARM